MAARSKDVAALGSEFEFGKDRRQSKKARRHPLNILFDPFYPLLVAAVLIVAGGWFFDIPIRRVLDINLMQHLPTWSRSLF